MKATNTFLSYLHSYFHPVRPSSVLENGDGGGESKEER